MLKIFSTLVNGLGNLTIVVKSSISDVAGFLDPPLRFVNPATSER